MKKALVILVAVVFVVGLASAALAALDITLTPTTYDSTGASAWHFGDKYDTVTPTGVVGAKHEGSYREFDATGTLIIGGNKVDNTGTRVYSYADDASTPVNEANTGPHGGYISTSNKCKACHGVHRAQGTFALLRADDQDSACDYCHVGAAPHSERAAYYRSTAGKYTSNGHTIGADSDIPDSSVWQWEETATITDADGNTKQIAVRQYNPTRNKMMKWGGHGGIKRTGPWRLQCMTCHQVHNATLLVWKPGKAWNGPDSAGYMLLRNAPSGSVDSKGAMESFKVNIYASEYHGTPPNVSMITVPETTISASNTGAYYGGDPITGTRYTIWTRWQGSTGVSVDNGNYLAVWCADCHNLNIGYPDKSLGTEFGKYSHTARTHPVPYMITSLKTDAPQCESCHVNDMWPELRTGQCGVGCHIKPSTYGLMKAKSDYPHSGSEGSTKLLGDLPDTLGGTSYVMVHEDGSVDETNTPFDYVEELIAEGGELLPGVSAAAVYEQMYGVGTITTAYDKSTEHIDLVCLRCHGEEVGIRQ
ncbi:MAG: hypothetical protein AB1743_03910 [Actinomycetota bacterium]